MPGSTGRLIRHEYRPLMRGGVPQEFMPHQTDMADAGLTYHYQIFGGRNGHRQDSGRPDGD